MKITQKAQDLETFVQAILSEKLKVGEVIRQSELCDILETSMSPLRELLVLLEELELVEVKPRAGFRIIYPDIEFMRENMQFRILIENHAIGTFIEGVTDPWINEQIRQHKDALTILETAEDLTEYNDVIVEFDRSFHRTIVASLKNRAMSKAHEYTQTKLRIARRVHRRIPPRKININAMKEHLAILEALKSGDFETVRSLLDAHFTGSIRNTLVGF
ncbi:GntR family transcriptional regulator [bacterium]|nr:GntR family transcriptional regulator [bacterium]